MAMPAPQKVCCMTYEGYAVAVSSTGVLYDLRGYAVAMPAPQKVCCMTYEGYAVAVSSTEGVLYDLRGLCSGCQLYRRCVV